MASKSRRSTLTVTPFLKAGGSALHFIKQSVSYYLPSVKDAVKVCS